MKTIFIKGAAQHNLKHIDVRIPRDSFVVISGPSGSGKSSLAFDTIFAEGQRRFVESLSAYVRQFLGRLEKPKVDYIEGLSPAIAIEQKTSNRNPRSTVGTITEIFDYFRLLFARIGEPHDPLSGKKIERQTVDQIIDIIYRYPQGCRCIFFAPMVRNRKGTHQRLIEDIRKSGFYSLRINGKIYKIDELPIIEKQKRSNIDILIDRIRISTENRTRVLEAIETSLNVSDGLLVVQNLDSKKKGEQAFSLHYAYTDSNLSFPQLEPALFSFNSPLGACSVCSGLGIIREFNIDLIIPDSSKSFLEGAFLAYPPTSQWFYAKFSAFAHAYRFDLQQPVRNYSPSAYKKLLYGDTALIKFTYTNEKSDHVFEKEEIFPGIFEDLRQRYRKTSSQRIRGWLEKFMLEQTCPSCKGQRLRAEARSVLIKGKNIQELSSMTIVETLAFFEKLNLSKDKYQIVKDVLKEIRDRLSFLVDVGLDYLTLHRGAASLSGGEAQRIRLASQLGSSLTGVLYVLDEPTIGLHQHDNERLLRSLKKLRDLGNTLIVVEHDEQTLRNADYIIDMGPGAGTHGGQIVSQGTPKHIIQDEKSLTGRYLSGKEQVREKKHTRKESKKYLRLTGVTKHNISKLDVEIPLGVLTVVTGVSGSGKSTLISDVLLRALQESQNTYEYHTIEGISQINKVLEIDQSPIGRTPRSNPATYVGVFTPIREVFAMLPESRARGYTSTRFSFNMKGGRCESCLGAGVIKIDMQFLPDVYIPCNVCKGKRYTKDTLDIFFKKFNIYDILNLTVDKAYSVFSAFPSIRRKLKMLSAVGLGYITLGQSALSLSGGEAQRVKLALELSKRTTGATLCVMDEPTTGLHFEDIKKLLAVIDSLVEKENTVVIIEHNMDVICHADYIIDLGPSGGKEGGKIVASGTPEEVAQNPRSITGRFIKHALSS